MQPTEVDGPGAIRRVTVAGDGSRVVFLRTGEPDDRLCVYDVGSATEHTVATAPTLEQYAIDPLARSAVFPDGGRLYQVDLVGGAAGGPGGAPGGAPAGAPAGAPVRSVPTVGPAVEPRLDPTGQLIGYRTGGGLRVRHPDGRDELLAGEPDPADGGHPGVSWAAAEPAAYRYFGRHRGWWWAPDGGGVLATRVDTARTDRIDVSLHLLDLDGGWVDVHWDRETYPYLVAVSWGEPADPLLAVLRRGQQHGLVLAVDVRTGETQVHAELADPRWVEPIPGTPCHLADGRVLVGGELAHDGYDARCLFADGTLLTPPSLYVRRVAGRLPGSGEVLVEASDGEPGEQHLYGIGTTTGIAGADARRLTSAPGWHRAAVGGETLVVGSESFDHGGVRWAVWRGELQVGVLAADPPADPPRSTPRSAPRPAVQRVTDRRLPAGVLYPRTHVTGRRLPVLVTTGLPGQAVRVARDAWLDAQDRADDGYAVVVVDHRGTPGVAPSFEKVVHRRLADLSLADLTEALGALTGKHPDLDLERVAIRGHGVAGWLAGMAALRRPELFRCAVAVAPIVDWEQHDRTFAQRYLGLSEEGSEVYHHHSLLAAASEPVGGAGRSAGRETARPLLLVPGDDERFPAEPVGRLAEALRVAGRPYTLLPAAASEPEVRAAEREFLRRHLG